MYRFKVKQQFALAADALLGFKTQQAGVIAARRERGVWKIDRLLAVSLP